MSKLRREMNMMKLTATDKYEWENKYCNPEDWVVECKPELMEDDPCIRLSILQIEEIRNRLIVFLEDKVVEAD